MHAIFLAAALLTPSLDPPPLLVQERREFGERRERCERIAEELGHTERAERRDEREGERREAREEEARIERLRHEYREHRCEEVLERR